MSHRKPIPSRTPRRRRTLGATLLLVRAAAGATLFVAEPEVSQAIPGTGHRSGSLAKGDEFACTVALVNDGDTFRCYEEDQAGDQIRVRLSGIAARETNGTCGKGHPCPDASAAAATVALTRIALDESLSCQTARKTYNRVAAFCRRTDGVDLSCAMLDSGTVAKWPRYWGDHAC